MLKKPNNNTIKEEPREYSSDSQLSENENLNNEEVDLEDKQEEQEQEVFEKYPNKQQQKPCQLTKKVNQKTKNKDLDFGDIERIDEVQDHNIVHYLNSEQDEECSFDDDEVYEEKENYLKPKIKHLIRPKTSQNNNTKQQSNSLSQVYQKPILKQSTKANTVKPVQPLVVKKKALPVLEDKENEPISDLSNDQQFDQPQNQNERPKTAISFKPVYTISINEFKVSQKQYDYKNKKFCTVQKKSDPVSRYQSLKKTWNSTKFLSNNKQASGKDKQGRKLQLCERIASSQPDFIFHKYLNKDQTKMMF